MKHITEYITQQYHISRRLSSFFVFAVITVKAMAWTEKMIKLYMESWHVSGTRYTVPAASIPSQCDNTTRRSLVLTILCPCLVRAILHVPPFCWQCYTSLLGADNTTRCSLVLIINTIRLFLVSLASMLRTVPGVTPLCWQHYGADKGYAPSHPWCWQRYPSLHGDDNTWRSTHLARYEAPSRPGQQQINHHNHPL